jgi:hypothetical protein
MPVTAVSAGRIPGSQAPAAVVRRVDATARSTAPAGMIDAMAEMTPRERWKAVLDGRGADRPPCDYWATAELLRAAHFLLVKIYRMTGNEKQAEVHADWIKSH